VLLPSEEVKSEQIEDILAMFCEMGVNVVETKEADPEETLEDVKKEPEEEESDGALTEVQRSTPAETKKSEPGERTDDPVRMYLREWARSSCSHRHVARTQNNHRPLLTSPDCRLPDYWIIETLSPKPNKQPTI
jgi:sigma-70-like protein